MKNKLILLIGAKGRFGDANIQYISKSKIPFKTVSITIKI